ncbi:MAG TPA: hypothetical protein VHV10_05520, partial [Ktedonobacteraceae bacterium]|nr:hypothetical protein [Ktedonobacteraceae bacterium]
QILTVTSITQTVAQKLLPQYRQANWVKEISADNVTIRRKAASEMLWYIFRHGCREGLQGW